MLLYSPETYAERLNDKVSNLKTLLSPFDPPEPDVFTSPKQGFRLRTEFRIWHQDDRCFYAMFHPENKHPIEITEFPIASLGIQQAMPTLLQGIHEQPLLKHKLYQVEFLSTLSQQLLITLIYHKPLDDQWMAMAKELEHTLNAHIIGRSRKQKCVISQDYLIESLQVDNKQLLFQQLEGSFTQPNGQINQKMLSWVKRTVGKSQRDLLEMYCGNGNFSLALAEHFNQVLATELSKNAINSARENASLNQINNVCFVRMSAEDFTQALQKTRTFRRLKDINLDDYDFSTVLVDPPRAGLDQASCSQIQGFESIVYISCNPNTLAGNLKVLTQSHRITALAAFDQFPYTHHLECAVLLSARTR